MISGKNNSTQIETCPQTAESIQFTNDEFLLLADILHQVNMNLKEYYNKVMRSHVDFVFGKEHAAFRSLVCKLFNINLRKAIHSLEGLL